MSNPRASNVLLNLTLAAVVFGTAGCSGISDFRTPWSGPPLRTKRLVEGYPIWYKDLGAYEETHPGEYIIIKGISGRSDRVAWEKAWAAVEEIVPPGTQLSPHSWFYLDKDAYHAHRTWNECVGFRELVVLYKKG